MLEQLLVRNITLPASVKTTIESKINAEQEAQKMTFVLQKEKQEAERKRVEAQGIADYQRIISLSLSDKQLQYEMIKAIANFSQCQAYYNRRGKRNADNFECELEKYRRDKTMPKRQGNALSLLLYIN